MANKLCPAHNEREELEPTDPVQGYDTISKWHWDKETTVKDGKKQCMWTGEFTDSRAEFTVEGLYCRE